MAGSWPGGLQARARAPISRFVLQKETVDTIPCALDSAEVRSKIWAFDVLTPGCLEKKKKHPSSEPDGACCMLGAARQCYGSHLWF